MLPKERHEEEEDGGSGSIVVGCPRFLRFLVAGFQGRPPGFLPQMADLQKRMLRWQFLSATPSTFELTWHDASGAEKLFLPLIERSPFSGSPNETTLGENRLC